MIAIGIDYINGVVCRVGDVEGPCLDVDGGVVETSGSPVVREVDEAQMLQVRSRGY